MQYVKNFTNGYGVSAITGPGTYSDEGTCEIAVLHYDHLCYATPITSDVLGYQTPDDLDRIIAEVEALPEVPHCQHKRPQSITA